TGPGRHAVVKHHHRKGRDHTTMQPSSQRAWRNALLGPVAVALLGTAMANQDLLRIQQDPGQVAMANVNYNGNNFSPLDRINTFNVRNLQVKWTCQLGVTDSMEAPPLVVGDTMYLLTPK